MPDVAPAPLAHRIWEATKLHVRRASRCDFSRERATAAERAALAAAPTPVTAPHVQDYLAWRRSMGWFALVPYAAVVLFAVIDFVQMYEEKGPPETFRLFTFAILVTHFGLLVGLLSSVRRWREGAVAARRLWVGWLVSFLGPILVCLVPLIVTLGIPSDARGPLPEVGEHLQRILQQQATDSDVQVFGVWVQRLTSELVRLVLGLAVLIELAPTFLALFPAVARAGLTVKTLLPGRSAAAGIAGLMAPLYAAGFLLVGVLLQQIGGSFWLALGLLIFLCGPLSISRSASSLTAPMSAEEAGVAVRRARGRALRFVAAGGLLIVISLFLMEIVGVPIVAFSGKSMLGPFDLLKILLNYAASVTAVTLVASDWLVRGMRVADRMATRNAASDAFVKDAARLGDVAGALARTPAAAPASPVAL